MQMATQVSAFAYPSHAKFEKKSANGFMAHIILVLQTLGPLAKVALGASGQRDGGASGQCVQRCFGQPCILKGIADLGAQRLLVWFMGAVVGYRSVQSLCVALLVKIFQDWFPSVGLWFLADPQISS